jgi:hypothetical protein
MITGSCRYQFNPSELYQRTKPGQGIETSCGGLTYPAQDEPELGMVRLGDGTVEYRRTGRMTERSHPDPYCPRHGGSAEPPPPPVSQAELEAAYQRYAAMAQRFQVEQGSLAAAAAAAAPELQAAVTADQVTAAAQQYADLAAAASAAGVSVEG